jgi:hypothetical protein
MEDEDDDSLGTSYVKLLIVVLLGVLFILFALSYRAEAQENSPQKAVEILLRSRSELNRTNVWSLTRLPEQRSVSVGRRDETLPLTQSYRPAESYVHYRVPELNVRFVDGIQGPTSTRSVSRSTERAFHRRQN